MTDFLPLDGLKPCRCGARQLETYRLGDGPQQVKCGVCGETHDRDKWDAAMPDAAA